MPQGSNEGGGAVKQMDAYLGHLKTALHAALEPIGPHLFLDEEREVAQRFLGTSARSQGLSQLTDHGRIFYSRLLRLKGPWFRTHRLLERDYGANVGP
jgi:hypothetical protein